MDRDNLCNNCCGHSLMALTVEDILKAIREAELELLVGDVKDKK